MKTLFDKVWDSHVLKKIKNGPDILFIDRHFIHEVTSPIAFSGLEKRNLSVMYPNRTFATADHNTPTINQHLPIKDILSANQLKKLEENCNKHKISYWGLGHKKNGIIHVIGPENGLTLPGMTIVCGDSHTSTHGAFGSIAFGIGTSEVEMVLATQCIIQSKPKKMKITINGSLGIGVTPKDVALYIISQITTSGGTGYFIEYSGEVFKKMTMEGRMTVCNLSIESGARGGMIAPDETTFNYIKNIPHLPNEIKINKLINYWETLYTDKNAYFDKEYTFQADKIEPMITYGTNPGMGIGITQKIPSIKNTKENKINYLKSLNYMGYNPEELMQGKKIDYIFLGSCTNGRIEDFRAFSSIVKGKKKSKNIIAWLVPGSQLVASQIEKEGILDILIESGFTIRQPGCSACLAMNDDKIPEKKYVVSTSNRNFEGRQGPKSRTLLASPYTAAAAAITGELTDPRIFL